MEMIQGIIHYVMAFVVLFWIVISGVTFIYLMATCQDENIMDDPEKLAKFAIKAVAWPRVLLQVIFKRRKKSGKKNGKKKHIKIELPK